MNRNKTNDIPKANSNISMKSRQIMGSKYFKIRILTFCFDYVNLSENIQKVFFKSSLIFNSNINQ